MADEVVIACAITGTGSRSSCPNLPYTPEEYASEARRARDAGATVVHVHARDPETGRPSHRTEHFKLAIDAIRAEVPDIIINQSTGAVGVPASDRGETIRALRPEIATVNMGSLTYATRGYAVDTVFGNTFTDMQTLLAAMKEAGTRPEYECYEAGHIANTKLLIGDGIAPANGGFCLILGITGALPADPVELVDLVRRLPPDSHWHPAGVGPQQWALVAIGLALGGSVRVGFEDNAWLTADLMATSNGELVEKAAGLAAELGRPIAGPARARQILDL